MSKEKKSRSDSALAQLRERYASGDVRHARELARSLAADASASAEDRAEAEALIARTTPDSRAVTIGLLALALAAFVVGVFLIH